MPLPADSFDVAIGAGLLLFTGAEIATPSTIVEIISKFGVIAVLWYWIQDMKKSMKEQLMIFKESTARMLDAFDKETDEIRKHYDRIADDSRKDYNDYKDRWDSSLKSKEEEVKELHKQMIDLYRNKTD